MKKKVSKLFLNNKTHKQTLTTVEYLRRVYLEDHIEGQFRVRYTVYVREEKKMLHDILSISFSLKKGGLVHCLVIFSSNNNAWRVCVSKLCWIRTGWAGFPFSWDSIIVVFIAMGGNVTTLCRVPHLNRKCIPIFIPNYPRRDLNKFSLNTALTIFNKSKRSEWKLNENYNWP